MQVRRSKWVIYLDNAATTNPKPAGVAEAVAASLIEAGGNPGRAGHEAAQSADRKVQLARHGLAKLIGASSPERVVFTLNGTDALNIAIKGCLRPGDHVVTGNLEHNSVRRPIAGLAAIDISATIIEADAAGFYRPQDVEAALQANTRLVALTHASNVLGTVQPVVEVGRICRSRAIPFLVDAAQTVGCWPIDVEAMNVDLLAAPAHKGLFAPMGLGFLYVARGIDLFPWREGGTGGDSREAQHPVAMPQRLEAGTPNVPGIAGLLEGLRFIEHEGGPAAIAERDKQWTRTLIKRLDRISAIERLSPPFSDRQLPIVSFRCRGYAAEDVAAILDSSFGIAVRAGLHCAPSAHKHLKSYPEGAIRVSGSALSREGEIELLAAALEEIVAAVPSG